MIHADMYVCAHSVLLLLLFFITPVDQHTTDIRSHKNDSILSRVFKVTD